MRWSDPAKRRRFGELLKLAEEFGLVVHELKPDAGPVARKKWTERPVRADDALDRIKIAGKTGVPFDDFVRDVYLPTPASEAIPLAWGAARSRAKVAVSKMYSLGDVEKRYAPDGKLILVATAVSYKREDK